MLACDNAGQLHGVMPQAAMAGWDDVKERAF